jgi:hypothetical protein
VGVTAKSWSRAQPLREVGAGWLSCREGSVLAATVTRADFVGSVGRARGSGSLRPGRPAVRLAVGQLVGLRDVGVQPDCDVVANSGSSPSSP